MASTPAGPTTPYSALTREPLWTGDPLKVRRSSLKARGAAPAGVLDRAAGVGGPLSGTRGWDPVPADWDHVWLPYWLGLLDKSGELLDFYELIHVIQWRLLGPEAFLATYAAGLETFGYRNSPL
jgi:hypothetical protein